MNKYLIVGYGIYHCNVKNEIIAENEKEAVKIWIKDNENHGVWLTLSSIKMIK